MNAVPLFAAAAACAVNGVDLSSLATTYSVNSTSPPLHYVFSLCNALPSGEPCVDKDPEAVGCATFIATRSHTALGDLSTQTITAEEQVTFSYKTTDGSNAMDVVFTCSDSNAGPTVEVDPSMTVFRVNTTDAAVCQAAPKALAGRTGVPMRK